MSYPRWAVGMTQKGALSNPLRWPGLFGDGPSVLSGIDLEVRSGQAIALVGANGSGKSTLLGLLAGVLSPRSGRVTVEGKVSPLLERAAGFHPDLTGRENALLYGSLLGEREASLHGRLEDIKADSGLAAAFEDPVKVYSFGMTVRLGLAASLALEPDLFLMDDHALGDFRFQDFRRKRLADHRARGAAIVMATHALETAAELCDEAVWLEGGRVKERGPVSEVIARYRRAGA
jgi:ABC-type polysaccharide/polyol phosphate transport system ATPase subunit